MSRAIAKSKEMIAIARRLVWSEDPGDALEQGDLFLAQVMVHGLLEDVLRVEEAVGIRAFAEVLRSAPPGIFDPRSWSYWHLKCGIWPPPPLPQRCLNEE